MNNNVLKQQGRSMIEMLGVLAIIGLLSAGGIMGYSAAMEKYKINKMIEEVKLVAASVEQLYKNAAPKTATPQTDITETLYEMGILPSYPYKTPFGTEGRVDIIEKTSGTCFDWSVNGEDFVIYAPCRFIQIGIGKMPEQICAKLVMTDFQDNGDILFTTYLNHTLQFFDGASIEQALDFCRQYSASESFYFEVFTYGQ